MKVKEVPFQNVTVGMLKQFEQDGITAIADGDKKVFRIMPRQAVSNPQVESEALNAFLAALR